MSLPILNNNSASSVATNEDLVRHFHRCELRWSQHLSEGVEIDAGTALFNTELNEVHDANRMFSAALPQVGDSAEKVFEEVHTLYEQNHAQCHKWVMNPAASRERTQPLVDLLLSKGYGADVADIMHLSRLRMINPPPRDDLKIFSARASFRHTRQIAEQWSRMWNAPQLVDAFMLHGDDPHYDALIAVKDGNAIASIGVHTDNAAAIALYASAGFKKVGEIVEYHRPR